METGRETAVVVGSSIAGMLAAAILQPHFQRVILCDRDESMRMPRPGVPQAYHTHALLERGLNVLNEFFPGFESRLYESGAYQHGYGAPNVRIYRFGGFRAVTEKSELHIIVTWCSRNLLETVLRDLFVAQYPNVEFSNRCNLDQINIIDHRVTGVRLNGERPQELNCDFLVDATGTRSVGYELMKRTAELPLKQIVHPHVVCYSALVKRYDTEQNLLLCHPSPAIDGKSRMGFAYPVENDHWIITLGGYGEQARSIRTKEEFLTYAQALPITDFLPLIELAEFAERPRCFAPQPNCLIPYDQCQDLPFNFVALGDSFCTLNPSFGQGISTCAIQAEALRETLKHGLNEETASNYFRRARVALEDAWYAVTAYDTTFDSTTCSFDFVRRPEIDKKASELQVQAHSDPEAGWRLNQTGHLLRPLSSLLGVSRRATN